MADQRTIIPIVLGEGIDRATGKTALRPGAMRDVRNVILFGGRALVRPGLLEVERFHDENGDPMTALLAGEASRTEAGGVVVGYRAPTGGVYVFRTDADSRNAVLLQHETGSYTWFNVTAGDRPPVVFLAHSAGKVFMAHSTRSVTQRADTMYYDPLTLKYHTLRADLANEFPGAPPGTVFPPVKFRGVAPFRDYLVGWGFGSNADQDRAEVVRVSLPGRPTEWRFGHYWLAGQPNEPVLNCSWCDQTLVVLKEHELHRTVGSSHKDFGILPLDPLHGLLGERNVIYYNGLLHFWSPAGPRATDGQSSTVDSGIRLDIDGFEPADLERECDIRSGFAGLRKRRKTIEFVFGRLSYALSFLAPDEPKWSYMQYAVPLNCFYRLADSETFTGTISGYPQCDDSANWPSGTIRDQAATPRVRHVAPPTGGVLELWLRPNGSAWPNSPTVSVLIEVGQYQAVRVTGLTPATLYDIAWRYRVGTRFGTGYELPDPDTWPSQSVCIASFTTTNNTRRIESAVWSRTDASNEQILLTWSGGDTLNDTDVEFSTDGITFNADTTVVTPDTTRAFPANAYGETYLWFRVKDATGSFWSQIVKVWVGPEMPRGFVPNTNTVQVDQPPRVTWWNLYDFIDPSNPFLDYVYAGFEIEWRNANAAYNTEIALRTETGGDYGIVDIQFGPLDSITQIARRDQGRVYWKVRHKVTSFGVDDFSDFTPEATLLLPPPT